VQASCSDPGTVPEEWLEKVNQLENPPFNICRKSGLYKPPRSHFDSVTGRLVLNFDHFCPWVCNSVGFFNRKFFIQFLAYTSLATAYGAVCLGYLVYTGQSALSHKKHASAGPAVGQHSTHTIPSSAGVQPATSTPVPHFFGLFSLDESTSVDIMTLMASLIDAVFAVSLTLFCAAHVWMATRNQTTIESASYSRPYRLDWRRNMESVFGRNRWHWVLPVYGEGPAGDGVHWPLQDGSWAGLASEAAPMESSAADAQPATTPLSIHIGRSNSAANGMEDAQTKDGYHNACGEAEEVELSSFGGARSDPALGSRIKARKKD
jgi:palmitoyltransferase